MSALIFDTHAHYDDDRFDSDRDRILSGLNEKGVGYVLNAGCDLASSRKSVKLAKKYPFVYAAVGIHPESADEMNEEAVSELTRLAAHKKVRAIGEIGLDYHYDFPPRALQRTALERQLELACALDLPVIIHDREAHEDAMNLVLRHKVTGVFHCFSGSVESAKILTDAGWYLSFTGVVTFKNARRVRAVIESVPLDRIMIETDCPYMAPEPYRGRRNDSSYLPFVAEEIARIRGLTAEEIISLTCKNARRFFRLDEPGNAVSASSCF